MQTLKDSDITNNNVIGDQIYVELPGYIGIATRMPADGLCTFDFTNTDGELTHIHVGHALTRLSFGPPR